MRERERFISSHNIVIQTERVGGLLQDLRIPNVMLSSVKRLLVTIATAVNPIKRNTNLKPRSQPGRLNQQAILRAVNPAGSHGKPGAASTAGCHHSQDGVGPAHPERERLSPVRGAQPAQSVEPNQEKILWPGARPSYPSF